MYGQGKRYKVHYSCPHCPDAVCSMEKEAPDHMIVYATTKRGARDSFTRQKGCKHMKAYLIEELR